MLQQPSSALGAALPKNNPTPDANGPVTWIVTRHSGALHWLNQAGWRGVPVAHLDPQQVRPGDQVIGTLPVQLAAAVCTRGGRYSHLTLDVPPDLRGKEMSPEQMQQCRARLEGFSVQPLATPAPATLPNPPAGRPVW